MTPTPLPPGPGRAYVVNRDSNNVTVIDTSSNSALGTISVGSGPVAVGVDPTVHRAYVTNFSSNNVTVIDTTTNFIGGPIPAGSGPVGVGIGP